MGRSFTCLPHDLLLRFPVKVLLIMPCRASEGHRCVLRVVTDGYPRDEMIYKWRKNSVEAADQKSWRLYQFDFMGLRNTTDILKTSSGKLLK